MELGETRKLKLLLGITLGEVLRTQKRVCPDAVLHEDDTIYGLLHGLESVIDGLLEATPFVSRENQDAFEEVLEQADIRTDEGKAVDYRSQIEPEAKSLGMARSEVMRILTYHKLGKRYSGAINAIQSNAFCPAELKNLSVRANEL